MCSLVHLKIAHKENKNEYATTLLKSLNLQNRGHERKITKEVTSELVLKKKGS